MVIGIIGENCSGKSSLAEAIKNAIGADIITGKDYLRMAKIGFLPNGAVKILVKADIDTIKERFKKRMHGNLLAPVQQMLERKHGMFDNEICNYQFDGVSGDISEICRTIKNKII